jgi:hypothetical protein
MEQNLTLLKYFKEPINDIDLKSGMVDGLQLFTAELFKKALIGIRAYSEYNGKAFVLNPDFDWVIQKDSQNELCLIPTRKK